MKNILILCITILFFSCASKKAVLQSKVEQKSTQQNSIVDKKSNQIDINKTVTDEKDSNIKTVTKTVIYDTDKPEGKDGKPPIKAEITTTQEKSENNTVKTDVNLAKKDKSTHTDNSKTDTEDKEQIKTVEKSKPVVNYYLYILGLIALIVAGFLIYKNIKRIKTFLGLLS